MDTNSQCDVERDVRRHAKREMKGRLIKERITKDDGRYLIYYSFERSDEGSDLGRRSDTARSGQCNAHGGRGGPCGVRGPGDNPCGSDHRDHRDDHDHYRDRSDHDRRGDHDDHDDRGEHDVHGGCASGKGRGSKGV